MPTPMSLTYFDSAENSLRSLESGKLRWSAPVLSDDPFALNHQSMPDFDRKSLHKALVKFVCDMIFAIEEPQANPNISLIAAIKRWRANDRFQSEEEAVEILDEMLTDYIERHMGTIAKYLGSWKKFAASVRMVSLYGKPENLSAWETRGHNHSGIALRLEVGEGAVLNKPQQVNYQESPATVTSKLQQVQVILGMEPAPDNSGFLHKLTIGNKRHADEEEFRCFSVDSGDFMKKPCEQWYLDKAFNATELRAAYLGLATSAQHRQKLLAVLKLRYPNCKIYQAVKVPGQYQIDYQRLDKKA